MTPAEQQHAMEFDLDRNLPRDIDGAYWVGGSPYLPLPEIGPSSITKEELDELATKRAEALARYEAKLTPAKSAGKETDCRVDCGDDTSACRQRAVTGSVHGRSNSPDQGSRTNREPGSFLGRK